MQLIQVVPRARPGDGVADYATRLAEALRERHGVTSTLIEAGWERDRTALMAALGTAAPGDGLLLHYVGYGYARRGAPLWLARVMARARRVFGARLGAVFHELYATGHPWQSAFWLSGLQQHVVTRIARACSFALLTRTANRRWLEATGAFAGKAVTVLPMTSGVGEPASPSPVQGRPPLMVVWGSAVAKAGLYKRHGPSLAAACRRLGLSGIVDIGPAPTHASAGGAALDIRGRLPAAQLSGVLLEARCGVVACPAAFLAKSSIFAAYAAHGLAPIVLDEPRTAPLDGLVAGEHFLRLVQDGVEAFELAPLDAIAGRARDWYAGHTTAAHAEAAWRMLAGTQP